MPFDPSRLIHLVPVAAAVVALGLIGCAHRHHAEASRPAEVNAGLSPLRDASGAARSLSLDPVSLTAIPPRRAWSTDGPSWIDSRNDRGAEVFAGFQSPTVERSVTLTRDRQSTFNGRPYDSYRQRTYRESYVEAVR